LRFQSDKGLIMLGFIREVFSDDDGRGSFSRCGTALIVVVVLALMGRVVIHNGAFPDALTLGGLSAFMLTLYGANQLRAAFSKETPPQQ
jgi:hypothetical protein